MSKYVLTPNYREYVRLQRQLRKAIGAKDLAAVEALTEETRKVYSKLTDYETRYADWLCNDIFEYRPTTDTYHGVDVGAMKFEIKALAYLLQKENILYKYMQRNKVWDRKKAEEALAIVWPEEYQELYSKWRKSYTNTYKRYTQLCALRAAMRGKLHFSPTSKLENLRDIFGIHGEDWQKCPTTGKLCGTLTLEDQREWAEDIAYEFYPQEAEEAKKITIKKQPKKPWWQKALEAVIG